MLLRRLFPRLSRRSIARGAVMVEYAFLLVAVGIPTSAGLVAGGKYLYDGYISGRDAMLSPLP